MICEFCKYGADTLTKWKSGEPLLIIDPELSDYIQLNESEVYEIIRRSHKRCRGKTHCDCQHAEGITLNGNHHQ